MLVVVSGEFRELHLTERDNLRRFRLGLHGREAMADRTVCGAEAEPRITLGHCLYAIQSDIAAAGIGEHRLCQRQTIAFAAKLRRDDVEADKGERAVVSRNRTGRD